VPFLFSVAGVGYFVNLRGERHFYHEEHEGHEEEMRSLKRASSTCYLQLNALHVFRGDCGRQIPPSRPATPPLLRAVFKGAPLGHC